MNTTHANDKDCIFCKFISGEIPVEKVYEDDETFAFLDHTPVQEGHTLVIPKDHFENMYTTPAEQWCRVMLTVKKVAEALRHAVNADGINLVMNNEKAAGQEVHHAHVHVIPRHNDIVLAPWKGKPYNSTAEAHAIAEKVIGEIDK